MSKKEIEIHCLVPRRASAGGVEYAVESRVVRLPLAREDRREFRRRVERPGDGT